MNTSENKAISWRQTLLMLSNNAGQQLHIFDQIYDTVIEQKPKTQEGVESRP